jgi:hypothetical protein
LYLLSH